MFPPFPPSAPFPHPLIVGAIWVKFHPVEVEKAEYLLAREFAYLHPDDTAIWALKLADAYYASGRGDVDSVVDDVFR